MDRWRKGKGVREEFFSPRTEKSSLLTSHLPLLSWSRRLKVCLAGVPDILAPLIAMFAGCIGIHVKPWEQMAFNFKYY